MRLRPSKGTLVAMFTALWLAALWAFAALQRWWQGL